MNASTTPDTVLSEAVTLMHEINRRLMAGRLTALRLTWRGARVDCRVLDGETCAVLAPVDR